MEISEINRIIWELDKDPQIQSAKLNDGYLIWTRIRYGVFRLMLNQTQFLSDNAIKSENLKPKHPIRRSRLQSFIQNMEILWNSKMWLLGNYDGICINGSKIREKSHNDLFVGKSNLSIYQLNHIKLLSVFSFEREVDKNEYFGDVAFMDSLVMIAKLLSKFRSKDFSQDSNSVDSLFEVVKAKYNDNGLDSELLRPIREEFLRYVKFHYNLSDLIKIAFKRLKPKFIIIEDGNYGGGNMPLLIQNANLMGIKTIEIQHGVFDVAFQYEKSLLDLVDFKSQKTTHVLTFGKYWSDWIVAPGIPAEIGSVLLDRQLNLNIEGDEKYQNTILFCSQGSNNDSLLKIASQLSNMLLGKFKVFYKLHPKEYKLIDSYREQFSTFENLVFLSNVNTYEILKQSTFIVGSFSTLLFECIYFNKTPFVLDDRYSKEYIPQDVGLRFKNVEELFNLIIEKSKTSLNSNYYWEYNWKDNLIAFGKKEKLW